MPGPSEARDVEFSPRMLAASVLSGMPNSEAPSAAPEPAPRASAGPNVFRRRAGASWPSAHEGPHPGMSTPAPMPLPGFPGRATYHPYSKVRPAHAPSERAPLPILHPHLGVPTPAGMHALTTRGGPHLARAAGVVGASIH